MRGSLVVLASHFVARVSLLFAFLSLPFSVLQLSPLRTALFYGSNKRAWHGGVVSVVHRPTILTDRVRPIT